MKRQKTASEENLLPLEIIRNGELMATYAPGLEGRACGRVVSSCLAIIRTYIHRSSQNAEMRVVPTKGKLTGRVDRSYPLWNRSHREHYALTRLTC